MADQELYFENFPKDLQLEILRVMDPITLARTCKTSKSAQSLCCDKHLQTILRREAYFGELRQKFPKATLILENHDVSFLDKLVSPIGPGSLADSGADYVIVASMPRNTFLSYIAFIAPDGYIEASGNVGNDASGHFVGRILENALKLSLFRTDLLDYLGSDTSQIWIRLKNVIRIRPSSEQLRGRYDIEIIGRMEKQINDLYPDTTIVDMLNYDESGLISDAGIEPSLQISLDDPDDSEFEELHVSDLNDLYIKNGRVKSKLQVGRSIWVKVVNQPSKRLLEFLLRNEINMIWDEYNAPTPNEIFKEEYFFGDKEIAEEYFDRIDPNYDDGYFVIKAVQRGDIKLLKRLLQNNEVHTSTLQVALVAAASEEYAESAALLVKHSFNPRKLKETSAYINHDYIKKIVDAKIKELRI